jgi:signal transduction histidine kinase/ligand-binding sensor domain-containing protein
MPVCMLVCMLAGMLICALPCSLAGAQDFGFLQPQFDTISDSDSIPEGIITALAQDRAGFIWIGTQNGLLRYDGYRFRSFNNDPANPGSLPGDYIVALCASRDGKLWISTASDGVALFDPATEQFTRFAHRDDNPTTLASNRIAAIAEDGKGGVWLATDHGLDHWPGHGQQFIHYRHHPAKPASLDDDNVRSLLFDRNGRLWVGSASGLQRLAKNGLEFEQVAIDELRGKSIHALFLAQDGKLWLGTGEDGAAWLEPASQVAPSSPGGLAVHWLPLNTTLANALNHHWIRGIAQPDPGQIWLASYGGGINVVSARDGTVLQHLRHAPGLRGSLGYDLVVPLLQDRSGMLWVGTWGGGLQRFGNNNGMARLLRHSPKLASGLSHPVVISVLELANGQILLGLDGNGIDIIDRQRGLVGGYRTGQAGDLPEATVRALAQTPDGSIWAGTRQTGLVRLPPGGKVWQPTYGLPSLQIRKLLVDRSGRVWVATNHGVALWRGQLDTTGQPRFSVLPDEAGQTMPWPVDALLEDRQGRIWAGSQNGLWVWQQGASGWHGIHPDPARAGKWVGSLAGNYVTSLLQDRQGNLWVDTDKGLDRLRQFDGKQAEFEHVHAWFGPAGKDLGANLLEDQSGRIWTEAAVLDPQKRQMQWLGKADGLDIGGSWQGAYGKTRDGLLIFGGVQGAAIIDPQRFRPWRYAPPVVLTELKINGRISAPGGLALPPPDGSRTRQLTLLPGQRDFSIEFAALDYSDPKKNRYQYRLQGYDKDWINTDFEHRSIGYGNLWPGKYTLQVRGSNRLGQWSDEELFVTLRVLPAFWQSWWFISLALMATSAAIYLALRWRIARLRTRAHTLKSLIGERTADILKLGEIGRELAATLDMEQAFARVHRQVMARLDADVFLIGIVELGCLSFVYKIEHQKRLPNSIMDLDESRRPAVCCVRERREMIFNSSDELRQYFGGSLPPIHGDLMETVVYLPLLAGQQVIGCLSVQSPKPHAYNPDQLEFLRILASYTAIALSNSAAHHELSQSHEELAAALTYLRETQAKLIQAERQQISLDLHDNLSQTMTGVLLQLDTAREVLTSEPCPDAISLHQAGLPYVERAIELARDGITQTRHLLNQLRGAKHKVNPINLIDALRRDLPRLTMGTQIRVEVLQSGQTIPLPAPLELGLFRIAQEAVTNALRHAQAKLVTVHLTFQSDCVILTVTDDGTGFDPASPAVVPGMGVMGMKQRASQLSGTLCIESTPGRGCCVRATLPLAKE